MKYSLLIVAISLTLGACSSTTIQQGEMDVNRPINCATAEGDIRVLRSEKAHTSDQIKAGVSAIVPISMLSNAVKGNEGQTAAVATGDYNEMIDKKIAEIKAQCGLK